MKSFIFALLASVALFGCQQQSETTPSAKSAAAPPPQPAAQHVSGPYTHDNLTVFLIHGPDTLKGGENYLTLQEALEQKKLVVYETGNVNELAIENVSDQPVFITSGDIVKGGQQDRTIGTDLMCAAKSGKMPIAAFCVEHGRWTQRGAEPSQYFGSADATVVGNKMKLAGNVNSGKSDQGLVWASVSENQSRLSENVGAVVNSNTSPSSFQLSLESEKVQQNTDDYTKALGSAAEGKNDVIGYAIVVNGKISSADVYGSHALFAKLWPKLLKSSAVEALAARKDGDKVTAAVSAGEVDKFLDDAEKVKAERKQLNDKTEAVTYDAVDCVLLQTDAVTDTGKGVATVRRNYISKSADK